MKKIRLVPLFCAILYIFSSNNIIAQTETWEELNQQFNELVCSEQKASSHKTVLEVNVLTQSYDVSYYRAEWQVDPAVNYVNGKITTHFRTKSSNFGEIYFDLMSNMLVDSVKYHNNKCVFKQNTDNTVQITLPTILAANKFDSVSVWYQGQPIGGGFGSFIQSTHANTPTIWTLSEPYGARDWWPCKQDLQDKADSLDVIVTCPKGNRAASNGLLVEEYAKDSLLKVYHWKHRYPIACYLIAFAVTNYEQYYDYANLQKGKLPILNYVYPEDLAVAKTQAKEIVPIIEFYDSLFVPYPFRLEKYGHAEFGWGGGMEHQTMSFVVNFGYELIAHELAHQWFGDGTTCGSWEDIWLNEGFATYLSGLCYERFSKDKYWPQFKQGRINSITSQAGGSVWVNDTTQVGRIFDGRLSYAKGAMVLHQLRWELGDATFFQAIRNYLTDPKRQYGFAQTKHLKEHFEKASGKNLDEYFKDWFYGEGFPTYSTVWSQKNDVLTLRVDQTQSHPSVSFFEMDLPYLLTGENGEQKTLRLKHDFSGQYFNVSVPFTVKKIDFDPAFWLISKANQITVGTNQVFVPSDCYQITPNPTFDGKVNVLLKDLTPQNYSIIDVQGKILQQEHIKDIQQLDLSALSAGTYYLHIQTDKGRIVEKLIKQ